MTKAWPPTHVALNYGRYGRSKSLLPDGVNDPLERANAFTHLDGNRSWAEVWAPLPEPFNGDWQLRHINFDEWPQEYIQFAGRRGRLIIELRRLVDGRYKQFAVGRADSSPEQHQPSEVVAIGKHETAVFPNEVWTSAKATPVLHHWLRRGEIPPELTQRALNIRTDTPDTAPRT